MSTKEKRIKRLLQKPRDYTFDELRALMNSLGYSENNKGKTSGSRVQFVKEGKPPVLLHCPHNPPYLKKYMVNQLIDFLRENGEINE